MINKNDFMPSKQKEIQSKKVSFRVENETDGSNKFKLFTNEPSIEAIKEDSLLSHLMTLLGTENKDVSLEVIASAFIGQTPAFKKDYAHGLNISAQVLAESESKDLNESRLCLQSHSLFSQGMYYLDKANNAESINQDAFCMNSAIKLLRLHNETLEALNRYRRKGEQKVMVQHQYVQVNEGGKAVVGSHVVTGGGGVKEETKEEAHESKETMRSEIENQQSPTLQVKRIVERKVSVSRRKKHRA